MDIIVSTERERGREGRRERDSTQSNTYHALVIVIQEFEATVLLSQLEMCPTSQSRPPLLT